MISRRALAGLLAAPAIVPALARAQLFNPGAPTLGERDGLIAPSSTWTPSDLGASLLAWWDAERSDLITQAAGVVSSWRDIVGTYTVTAGTTAQPTYSATSFNNRPGLSFDGVANAMTGSVPASFPVAAAGCEMWALIDQLALDADVAVRTILAYGGSTSAVARRVSRARVANVSRFQCVAGDGATVPTSVNSTVSGNGRHVVRAQMSGSAVQTDVDAVAGPSVAVVPATTVVRLRIGAHSTSTASELAQMVASAIIVTGPLTTQQANDLGAWLTARL